MSRYCEIAIVMFMDSVVFAHAICHNTDTALPVYYETILINAREFGIIGSSYCAH